jgi:cyclopropane fatty-acyl-phospholipid synthase-like methyltransferase
VTASAFQESVVSTTSARAGRGSRRARYFYGFTYRHGKPRWDSAEAHPELKELLVGRPTGRALDLGCGTGADVIYLAQHGWDTVGVDFVPEAIETAERRACESGTTARFVLGDVTQLRETGVEGRFDLIMDTGCYHGIAASLRDSYVAEVAAVAAPGADFYLAGITDPPATWRLVGARGASVEDVHEHFDPHFELVEEQRRTGPGSMSHFVLYHLERRQRAAGSLGDGG